VHVRHFAVFSNWIMLRYAILALNSEWKVVLDLSQTRLVDHDVMAKLHELEREFEKNERKLTVVGLEDHASGSSHPHAARSK